MSSFGIVVISYNSADVIGECLDACSQGSAAAVVVVDNASEDDTIAEVRRRPKVQLIANRFNYGFAAAANQGIAALDTSAVLILNPDAVPGTGLETLASAAVADPIGAVGGRLVDAAGSTQAGFNIRAFPSPTILVFEALGINRLWPRNPVNRRYRVTPPIDRQTEVDQPAGAFLMVNKSAWAAIGGFDDRFYPIWFEDVDFCLRLRLAGYRNAYLPSITARHRGGNSANKLAWETRQLFWYGSLLSYAAKHFPCSGRFAVSAAVVIGFLPRVAARVLSTGGLGVVSVYSRVVWLAYLALGGRSDALREACRRYGSGAESAPKSI